MGKRETSLKEWRDRLSEDYSNDSIRRLYYKHNGSLRELVNISIKLLDKDELNSVKGRVSRRKLANMAWSLGIADNSYFSKQMRERAYKKRKSKGGGAILCLYELAFDHFFDNTIPTYFTDKGIKEETFKELEIILKEYYDDYTKIKAMENLIKQDSIKEREEKIKEILKQANSILWILNSNLHNELPTEVKLKTIREINKTTNEKLKELNLVPTFPYSQLLKALRDVRDKSSLRNI